MGKPEYSPTPQQIAEECEKIRAEWDSEQAKFRERARMKQGRPTEPWTAPELKSPIFDRVSDG